MKKLLLSLTVLGTATAAYCSGTVQFSNNAISRLSVDDGFSLYTMPTTPGLYEFGLFYGFGATAPTSLTLLTSQFGVNSTLYPGQIADARDGQTVMNTVAIPGTSVNESDVWVQIVGWSASFGTDWQAAKAAFNAGGEGVAYGQSELVQVAPLGADIGPGVPLWQSSTTSYPNRLHAFTLEYVPEPNALALAGFGATALWLARGCKRRG